MPPLAASDVDIPTEWRDRVHALLQTWRQKQRQRGRSPSILGAISLFDGRPRPWRLSDCLQEASIPCVSIDVRNSLDQDILSEAGTDYFLGCLVKLAPNSLLWMAPECSTWIWLNRTNNQRSLDQPQGETTSAAVHQANLTADFVARALKLATNRGQLLGVKLVHRSQGPAACLNRKDTSSVRVIHSACTRVQASMLSSSSHTLLCFGECQMCLQHWKHAELENAPFAWPTSVPST